MGNFMTKSALFVGQPASNAPGELVTDSFTFSSTGGLLTILGSVDLSLDCPGQVSVGAGSATTVKIGDSSVQIGFYGTTPADRPEIAATPTAQGIVDALKTLGLVTQAT